MNAADQARVRGRLSPWAIVRLKRTVRLGIRSLWLHRLRSLLTVLGIVFGVASVIAMLAVGEGASRETQASILKLGSRNIILQSVKPPEDTSATSQRAGALEYGIKYDDIHTIESIVPGVVRVVPARIVREYLWRFERKADAEIVGATMEYAVTRNVDVGRGRFFSETEFRNAANVCVLSAEAAADLLPTEDPLGSDVRIKDDYYRVIGVEADAGAALTGGPGASAAPRRAYIPLTTIRERFGEVLMRRRSGSFEAERVELHEATVEVERIEDVLEISLFIDEFLQRTHAKKDYAITVPLELLIQAQRTERIFNLVLGAIAAISLLVGGIGIMNIMLASVTERTREIGIRRALGAKRSDIISQFLVETVLLSGVGGVLGVLVGVTVPAIITAASGMETVVTLWSPIAAFSISAAVGVIFGLYPSLRAAEMDPVEALRHE